MHHALLQITQLSKLMVYSLDCRYDYENCESAPAEKMISNLESYIADPASIGKTYSHGGKTFKVAKADNFEYTDPIDHSVSKKQVC